MIQKYDEIRHHGNKQYQMAGDEGLDAIAFAEKKMEESSGSETGTSVDEIKLVEITITITEAKIMKGPRNEPFISFVTVEMGDNVLAVSDHCDLKEDNTFPFLLTFKLQINVGDYYKIDEFICKPLILTVTESAGLSKKVKDTISLCLCSVDMLPILLSSEFTQTRKYVMQFFEPPIKEPPIEPEVELKIHYSNGLLGQELLKHCNILQLTLEACYSLPGELIFESKPEELFVVGCSLPLLNENDEPIVFRNGTIVDGPIRVEEKKWYTANITATGKALHIADSIIQSENFEDDVGDFQDENDREFRQNTERLAKPIIVWNSEFRSLISPLANYRLIQKIREYKFLPLEFTRVAPGVKKKEMSYNAVAYVNLTPILFPGITSIHGAYQLHPLSEVDMKARTNKSSLFIRGTPTRQGSLYLMSVLTKKSLGRDEGVDKVKETLEAVESPQLIDGTYSEEANSFEENKTYLTLKISLLHPLVQQRPPEEIRQTVLELIPNRNLTFPKVDSAQKAVEDFGTQVCNTAALLLEDYKSLLIKDAAGSQTKDRLTTQDYRKTKFLHELKKTGKYFTCKEQLKYHVVKIVRDKFLKRSSFDSPQDFEEFLTTLYVYIIEEMHRSLNKYFGISDPTATPDPITSSEELRVYAADAFAVGRFDLAEKYNQLRIQRFSMDPGCWVDYGIYCLGVGNYDKAAECFHHALSIDNDYLRGLLLYGMVCDICGRTDQTETFLLHAVNSNPTKALAHTIVGLYYHGVGNSIGAETYYKQAYELSRGASGSESTLTFSAGDDHTSRDDVSIFLSSLPFLINCNVSLYSLRALAQDLTSFQCMPRGNYHFFMAKLRYLEEDYVAAELAVRDALDQDNALADVWSLSGHIYYALGNKSKAKQNYTRALAIQKSPVDLHIVYYKLGQLAMESSEYDKAKKNFLLTCKYSPSSLSWIGVGRACYLEEEYTEAEEALSEANILDNTNPEVWGYLTLVGLKTGRQDEVEQAYRFCCKCDLKDQALFQEIRNLAKEVGMSLTPV